MKKTLTERIYDFLDSKNLGVTKVIGVTIKDDDDEDGFIGDYIVKCVARTSNPYYPLGRPETMRTCVVDREAFRQFESQQNAIKWINRDKDYVLNETI